MFHTLYEDSHDPQKPTRVTPPKVPRKPIAIKLNTDRMVACIRRQNGYFEYELTDASLMRFSWLASNLCRNHGWSKCQVSDGWLACPPSAGGAK